MLGPARIFSRVPAAIIAGAALGMLSACGGTADDGQRTADGAGEAASAAAHFTHQQELVEQGGRLFVSDGCTGCHSLDRSSRFGPSFSHLAGSRVALTDGRHVVVRERFLQAALTDPRANSVVGYSPAPMIAAVKRLELSEHRRDVTALAAFIEQIGPENG